jgi:hypothetical protein
MTKHLLSALKFAHGGKYSIFWEFLTDKISRDENFEKILIKLMLLIAEIQKNQITIIFQRY